MLGAHGLIPAYGVGIVVIEQRIPGKAAVEPSEGGRYGAGKGEEQGDGLEPCGGTNVLLH